MPGRYDPKTFESKWSARWREAELFKTRELPGRPKFYGLDFFPYPSGAGLSVGHCRNYIPTDVLCRMKLMQGYNVLHPMGFDAFGLPAENEAIAKGSHPAPMVRSYGENYRRQMDLVGIGYDWSRSFFSSDPEYYRWTQWIFERLYKKGLAYRRMAKVNWCPKDQTVLADEEVEGGLCWRCGTEVVKKDIPQWFFKITAYAQRLLDDLDTIDWPEGIKNMQRNWIGRSEGVEFNMKVALPGAESADGVHAFRVFTTRIDTIFGMTFCVLAPEHPLVDVVAAAADPDLREAIAAYRAAAKASSDIDRQATNREKTGLFTGAYAINPANGKRVPIFIADYVLMGYGTGAIMAVPGHDQRDYDFATKFGVDVIPVIAPEGAGPEFQLPPGEAFEAKDGVLINSGEYDGLTVAEAQQNLGEWMEGLGIGERVVNFRLRDWLISRQRYWGCPIPVVHGKEGDEQLVPEDQLPVELPNVQSYEPSDDGSSPLSRIDAFVNVTDADGFMGQRETDTMGGFACSSWYFLRFCDPQNSEAPWDPERAKYWMPVDCYVGGAEHAVMHLLYARFWTKFLYDEGLISVKEPFYRLMNQGQVLGMTPYRQPMEGEKLKVGEDGLLCSFEEAKDYQRRIDAGELPADFLSYRWARMSKSKGNVVTPDEMVDQYGADALRVYELFVAPFEADVQWNNEGVAGASRFLDRVCRMVHELNQLIAVPELFLTPGALTEPQASIADKKAARIRTSLHQTIQGATDDVESFAFNTYIAKLMELLNELERELGGVIRSFGIAVDSTRAAALTPVPAPERSTDLWTAARSQAVFAALREAIETFILLLAPAAPFVADELWESMGQTGFTMNQLWPKFDAALAVEDTVTIAIQVNGKLRDTIEAPAKATQEELEALARQSAKAAAHWDGLTIRKVIVVPGKLVNFVVG